MVVQAMTGATCMHCGKGRPVHVKGTGECGACYQRRRRKDPEYAERSREFSRRWKHEHRDANRERDRERLRAIRDTCPHCGNSMRVGAARCSACIQQHAADRRALIVRLYAEGLPLKKIAEQAGSTPKSIGVELTRLRNKGVVGRRRREVPS